MEAVATHRDPPTEDNAGVLINMILFAYVVCTEVRIWYN